MIYLDTLKDIVLIGAALTGSIVAVKGLNTWRRQYKGQNEYELARKILINLFKYRYSIKEVRNPMIFSSELESPDKDSSRKMSFDEIRYYETVKVYEKRWQQVNDIKAELLTHNIEAEILWGDDFRLLMDELSKLETELLICVRRYLRSIDPNRPEGLKKAARNAVNKGRDVLYDDSDVEPDEYEKELRSAYESLKSYLQNKLKN